MLRIFVAAPVALCRLRGRAPVVATRAAALCLKMIVESSRAATARGGEKYPLQVLVAVPVALCRLRGRAFGVRDFYVCEAPLVHQLKAERVGERTRTALIEREEVSCIGVVRKEGSCLLRLSNCESKEKEATHDGAHVPPRHWGLP